MSTSDILKEIHQLPLNEKLFLIEKALKGILRQNYIQQMTIAAEELGNEYKTNSELTAFSNLDWEDFYETR
ncbi:MAG: hypothetical protein B6D37_08890 [Sphingobacteriales bacterium UTBCD1]|jgi:hypothetical protein|nr:MAG: hypothetical protein B6D37_08890 [Sphingobacteriales bacterium UTBCD1]